jgi:DNA-directed RNA polymerase subunit RPC12/RpoP
MECVECGAEIDVERPWERIERELSCPECGTRLHLVARTHTNAEDEAYYLDRVCPAPARPRPLLDTLRRALGTLRGG